MFSLSLVVRSHHHLVCECEFCVFLFFLSSEVVVLFAAAFAKRENSFFFLKFLFHCFIVVKLDQ